MNLEHANLRGTTLTQAKLLGADLTDAIILTAKQRVEAAVDETTILPAYLVAATAN